MRRTTAVAGAALALSCSEIPTEERYGHEWSMLSETEGITEATAEQADSLFRKHALAADTEDAFIYSVDTGLLIDIGKTEEETSSVFNPFEASVAMDVCRSNEYWFVHNHPSNAENNAQETRAILGALDEMQTSLLRMINMARWAEENGKEIPEEICPNRTELERELATRMAEYTIYQRLLEFQTNPNNREVYNMYTCLPSTQDMEVFSLLEEMSNTEMKYKIYNPHGRITLTLNDVDRRSLEEYSLWKNSIIEENTDMQREEYFMKKARELHRNTRGQISMSWRPE